MHHITAIASRQQGTANSNIMDYATILENMKINTNQENVSENISGIKSEEIDNLKEQSANIIKNITNARQSYKLINEKLKKATGEFNKFNETKKMFGSSYKELINMCLENNIIVTDESNFIDKLIDSMVSVEYKLNNSINALTSEKNKIIEQLTSLTTFINTSLKNEFDDEEIDNIQSGKKCGICIENDINCAFNPCGHTACGGCAENIARCHVCRTSINAKMKIYFS